MASRFLLLEDTIPALHALKQAGLRTVVLSNHVPELRAIVDGVGLGSVIDEALSSAFLGYEKPHPEAFRLALRGAAPEDAWMVGDSVEADVRGAEALGIPAILVRRDADGVRRQADTVRDAVAMILASRS